MPQERRKDFSLGKGGGSSHQHLDDVSYLRPSGRTFKKRQGREGGGYFTPASYLNSEHTRMYQS